MLSKKRLKMMLEMAFIAARRSTCERLQVGCVIANLDMTSILSYGYNGNYAGGPNTCDNPEAQGGCLCVHAETNALVKAPYLPDELVLITTVSPCIACAKLIINAGVNSVGYGETYRDRSGLELLVNQGISTYEL